MNETLRLPSVGGAGALDVVASRGLSMLALGNAAAALGGAAWLGWQVGGSIAGALGLGSNVIGQDRILPTANGWMQDPGGPPTTTNCDVIAVGTIPGTSKPAKGCRDNAAAVCAMLDQMVGGVMRTHVPGSDNNSCIESPSGARSQFSDLGVQGTSYCPGFIDALNPAYSQPTPGAAPGIDGKCPTGRYAGIANAIVAAAIDSHGNPTVGPQLGADIMNKGGPISGAQPGTITGPTSLPLPDTSSHTVNPDGSTVDTTTKHTVNVTYGPQTINYSTTNIVTTNNGGNVTTTTTTTGATPDTPDDACKTNPNSLGCAQFGSPPTDGVTPVSKPLQYTPDDLGFGSGSCPAPWLGDVHWMSNTFHLSMSYQPVCDNAPTIRVAILALAALSGAFIVVMGVSKT